MDKQDATVSPSLLAPAPPPVEVPPTSPRVSRRRWWLIGCGGSGAIAIIVVLVVVFVFVNAFSNSPLRHFPVEVGAAPVSDTFLIGTGGQNNETLVIDDPNSLTAAETYYERALNTNGWTVGAADPSQAASGDSWQFSESGSSAHFGITFVTMGAITEITVHYATGGLVVSETPTPQPVDSSVTALMLTPTEVRAALAPLPFAVTKYIDAEINGQVKTDHRAFLAADGTNYADIGLFGYDSSQAASDDYPNLVSSTCAVTSTHPKIGTASQTDEFACPNGVFGITFQQGAINCGIAAPSANVVEDLARAESAKLAQVSGA